MADEMPEEMRDGGGEVAQTADVETVQDDGLTQDEHARNRGVVEALLIAADVPQGASKLASVLGRNVGAREVRAYVDALNEEYAQTGRSFRITEVAGGFSLHVHPEFAPWIRQVMKEKVPPRLSAASLETLGILAFKQPLTKAEIEHIRGVAVDGVLRQLMEKSLVRIAGRSDAPGRPLLYGTTRDFLKHFGLKTLSDLPKLRELDELLKEEEQRVAEGQDSPLAGVLQPDAPEGESETTDAEADGEADDETAARATEDLEVDEQADDTEWDDAGGGAPESLSGPGGGGFAAGERPDDSGGQG